MFIFRIILGVYVARSLGMIENEPNKGCCVLQKTKTRETTPTTASTHSRLRASTQISVFYAPNSDGINFVLFKILSSEKNSVELTD